MLSCVAMMGVVVDRYERAGQALEERTQRLRKSYEALRDTTDEHAQTEHLAVVREISAIIARRVGSPLTAIRERSSALRQPDLSAEAEEGLVRGIDDALDRLNRLVVELLMFPKALDPQIGDVALDAIVERGLRPANQRSGPAVTIERDTSGGPRTVRGDLELLGSALGNVVENALASMPDGGVLAVSTGHGEVDGVPALVLEVRDTGPWTEPADDSGEASVLTASARGAALLLATAARIVRAHGGRVEVVHADEGTTVQLVLPIRASVRPPRPEERT